ncbi:hypothetical protein [Clostridium beijerinckii]|uniref:hypothetical protein n=1 Tax=Clostridium beijerinckii TaxID=1520 RepID=UPI00156E962A|nr:hypothetical protein [Clostridium beijerinckii]NRU52662.1 hypothetical protein [Clostridium beijerinckii]NYC68705.1 hypothetical protein [Clostridium beijerinckii]NYC91854.1 hypothetical protein [Clostridium beijerinckii]
MANTEMKTGINKIDLLGYIKEQKLNKIVAKDKEGNEYNAISGKMVLKCGEYKEIDVHVAPFASKELTSKGEVSKKYLTLVDIADGKLPTMASAKEDELPTVVNIWGNTSDDPEKQFTPNIGENMYKDKRTNEVRTNLQLNLGFGNITVKDNVKEEDFKAEFDVEIYVESIAEEIKPETNEATGRTIVSGYLPLFGGLVAPIELVAGIIKDDNGDDFDMGQAIFDNLREGDTFSANGDINFEKRITETKTSGKGFGRAKVETKTDYINEFNILYGELVEDPQRMFEEEDIKQALVQRDNKKEEVKNKEDKEETKEKKPRGMGGSSRTTEGTEKRQRRGF